MDYEIINTTNSFDGLRLDTIKEIEPTDLSSLQMTSSKKIEVLEGLEKQKDELKNTNLLIGGGYASELSSFEYMPQRFLGIDTSLFGTTNLKLYPTIKNKEGEDIKVHPFMILKEKAMDNTIEYIDRMQAIRYMAKIPYKNFIDHCVEASTVIIYDERIDPYEKFFFYANNDKYIKLEDNIVHRLHPIYFKEAKLENYPLEVTLLSARYIFINYSYDSDDRMDVLEYILNIADDKNETVYARAECADMLANFGEGNEVYFGKKIMEELGTLYDESLHKTIYTNAQNVHSESVNDSVRKIIRSLRKEFNTIKLQSGQYTLENIENDLFALQSNFESIREKIKSFFFRIMTDPSKYERLTLSDILLLVYYKIQTFDQESKNTCIKRLLEEALESLETCTTGYLTRIINVLSGFVEGEEFVLRMKPQDELRSAIFARIHTKIRNLSDQTRNDVLESIMSEDKSTFDDFMEIYSPEEELKEEYKDLLSDEDFKLIFEKCVNEYKGII
jgi:hypothetical protein